MQSDMTLPEEQRRNYTSVGNALSRIVKEEGVRGLWTVSAANLHVVFKFKPGCNAYDCSRVRN